ncbi:MAG: FAD-dependent oxidoreductase [Devosia sp.]
MKNQPHRLAADAPHGLGGALLDRAKPLRFHLNGRLVEGFTGDTVLSAALANGIQSAGRHADTPLALEESFAPLVVTKGTGPLPMDRTPAIDGAEFTTLGTRRDPIGSRGLLGSLRHLLVGPGRTLNHRYGDVPPTPEPWRSAPVTERFDADFAIIGGGVAGLAAAAAVAAAGKRAVLIERAPTLGGALHFFGAVEGEDAPDVTLDRLHKQLDGKDQVTRLLGAEAFALDGNTVKVHQVTAAGGHLRTRVLSVTAATIILATGALERLPVFAGNRAPGVVGALAAHARAQRYGVWPGRRVIVNTPHGYAYRLALRAADAGIGVQRIVDTRIDPHSRFVDFAKASGITLASGLVAARADPIRRNEPGLRVGFALAIEGIAQDAEAHETDQLIAAGNWQPDLALWLAAGGGVAWDAQNHWLAARGALERVVLVGAAAGWRSTTAAMASARAAVAVALGKAAPKLEDIRIDPLYESPDAPTPVAPRRVTGPAYLDRGISLVTRRSAAPELAQHPVALSLGDIAAAVEIGAMPPRDAGTVAAQRAGISGDVTGGSWSPPAEPAAEPLPPLPGYLAGRFGPRPLLCTITAFDPRHFEPGCLVFESSESVDPLKAIGVIYAAAPNGAPGGLAVLAAPPAAPDGSLFVRDSSGAVSSKITERLNGKK